jgi:hypothetical protein
VLLQVRHSRRIVSTTGKAPPRQRGAHGTTTRLRERPGRQNHGRYRPGSSPPVSSARRCCSLTSQRRSAALGHRRRARRTGNRRGDTAARPSNGVLPDSVEVSGGTLPVSVPRAVPRPGPTGVHETPGGVSPSRVSGAHPTQAGTLRGDRRPISAPMARATCGTGLASAARPVPGGRGTSRCAAVGRPTGPAGCRTPRAAPQPAVQILRRRRSGTTRPTPVRSGAH